jgi:hypothetical protein
MTLRHLTLISCGIFCTTGFIGCEKHDSPQAKKAVEPEGKAAVAESKSDQHHWRVRVEVLMVAPPNVEFLSILPELRDPSKIEAATTKLLEMTTTGEAILTGYPVIYAMSGQRAIAEAIVEKRYPSEFEKPAVPSEIDIGRKEPPTSGASAGLLALPTTFDTRNTGVTIEIEPTVGHDGKVIEVNMIPQRVEFLWNEPFYPTQTSTGVAVKIEQPQFQTTKIQTAISVQNGERLLIATQRLEKPAGYTEVFVLQAIATSMPQ